MSSALTPFYDQFFSRYSRNEMFTVSPVLLHEAWHAYLEDIKKRFTDEDTAQTLAEADQKFGKEYRRRKQHLVKIGKHEEKLGITLDKPFYSELDFLGIYVDTWHLKYPKRSELASRIMHAMWDCGDHKVSERKVTTLINLFFTDKENELKAALEYEIRHDGTPLEVALEKIEKFITPALRKNPAPGEPVDKNRLPFPKLTGQALYHFMWQVKRKLLGLRAERHMAPVFLSPEKGTGKSEFIRNFCEPFTRHDNLFYAEISFGDYVAENKRHALFGKPILNFDEMKGASRSEFKNFRSNHTAHSLITRVYHSQTHDEIINASTPIGSANAETIGECYPDPEPERRLFGILIETFINVKADKELLETLGHLTAAQVRAGNLYPREGFNASLFWRMVDPHLPCVLDLVEVERHQAESVADAGLDTFIEKFNLAIAAGEERTAEYTVKALHSVYKEAHLKHSQHHELLPLRVFGDTLIADLLKRKGKQLEEAKDYRYRARSGSYMNKVVFKIVSAPLLENKLYISTTK